MFDDFDWVDDIAQELRYNRWLRAVEATVRARAAWAAATEDRSPLKVCILEIGCGKNVPTCRMNTRQFGNRMAQAGAESTLIRINNDFPGPDVSSMMGGNQVAHIALRGGGLECIAEIDAAMTNPEAAALEVAKTDAAMAAATARLDKMLEELELEELT